jgi:hypothetical protein
VPKYGVNSKETGMDNRSVHFTEVPDFTGASNHQMTSSCVASTILGLITYVFHL